MPAQPLTDEQKADAERLRVIFKKWQAHRKTKGLPASQAEAAELLGLGFGQSAFSQYLRGEIPLNMRVVARCAALFGCAQAEISPALAAEIHALDATPAADQDRDLFKRMLEDVSPAARDAIEAILRADKAGEPSETFKLVLRLFPSNDAPGKLRP